MVSRFLIYIKERCPLKQIRFLSFGDPQSDDDPEPIRSGYSRLTIIRQTRGPA